MEYDKELEASISQALREDERNLSLPNNSLVDETRYWGLEMEWN